MGWINDIRSRLEGIVPIRGTLGTPSGDESFPVAISNEIMGGPFIYTTEEEMKTIHPIRLIAGCKCTLTDYKGEGKRITFILRKVPGKTLTDLGAEIEEYWELDNNALDANTTIEQEFSDSVSGTKPPFLGTVISKDAYNAGYKSDADYDLGDTANKIWVATYDPLVHKWVRQRTSATGDWGAPVKIDEGYEEGFYNDVRFQWKLTAEGAPARPLSLVNGTLNNNPVGWSDTPDIPDGQDYLVWIADKTLWKTNVIKEVYGDIQGEWAVPTKVSTDQKLVRYGEDANSTDFLNDTYWRPYFSPDDQYKASRITTGDPWVIERISGESGEYTDYVFKEYDDSYEPVIGDAPQTLLGYGGTSGWFDSVFTVTDGKTLYVSTSRKFSNGTFTKDSGWSIPVRYDGKNTIRAVAVPSGSTTFKYANNAGTQVVTPTSILITAKLFDAVKELDPADFESVNWYVGHPDTGTEIPVLSVGTAPNRNKFIHGVNYSEIEIFPENVASSLVIGLKVVKGGEDYKDTISLLDVTDGLGYVAGIESDGGWIYKGTESKTFTASFYENGVDIVGNADTVAWYLGGVHQVNALSVAIDDTQISGVKLLKLVVTHGGTEYVRTESLTDVADGVGLDRQFSAAEIIVGDPATSGNPDGWSTDSAGAIWVAEKPSDSASWNTPYKVKGEQGNPSGAFQMTVYRTAAPPATSPPSWTTNPPTAKVGASLPLVPDDWSADPESSPVTDSTIWGSKAVFYKNPANEETDQNTNNWTIAPELWSTPFKITHFAPAGGTAGTNGLNGWSPILRPAVDGVRIVMKLHEWVGGTGIPPAGEGSYLSDTLGLVAAISDGTDIRGVQGLTGNDGIFNPSDFWDGAAIKVEGSNGSPNYESWSIQFRRAKTGVIYYVGKCYRGGGGNRTVELVVDLTDMIPAALYLPAGTSCHVGAGLSGSYYRTGDYSPDFLKETYYPRIIRRADGSFVIRISMLEGWAGVFNGSYMTLTGLNT